MTLATFIVRNVDAILEEWVDFARTLSSSEGLDLEGLRDHARRMLLTVAHEMNTPQDDAMQKAKSRGEVLRDPLAQDTAALTHGDQRFVQGFQLEELIAEYRALRASVIRLWLRSGSMDERTLYELTRFNEGIDQLIAESVVSFSRQIDRARQLFMGVLGHDLRTDLHVILASADRLERHPTQEQIAKYIPHIRQSTRHVTSMIEDLLDVTRTRFGTQLPIESTQVDAASICEAVLHPFRQLYPDCDLRLNIDGDVQGRWDPRRLEQMLTNLVRNAFQHGHAHLPITLSASGDARDVIFSVHNHGPAILKSQIAEIFEPLHRGTATGDSTSLGLGLYIARVIAQAHHGSLTVTSGEREGTTFTARLPRRHIEADSTRNVTI